MYWTPKALTIATFEINVLRNLWLSLEVRVEVAGQSWSCAPSIFWAPLDPALPGFLLASDSYVCSSRTQCSETIVQPEPQSPSLTPWSSLGLSASLAPAAAPAWGPLMLCAATFPCRLTRQHQQLLSTCDQSTEILEPLLYHRRFREMRLYLTFVLLWLLSRARVLEFRLSPVSVCSLGDLI